MASASASTPSPMAAGEEAVVQALAPASAAAPEAPLAPTTPSAEAAASASEPSLSRGQARLSASSGSLAASAEACAAAPPPAPSALPAVGSPGLLNERLRVLSYDGGRGLQHTSGSAQFAVENLLVPVADPSHRSRPGVGWQLVLECSEDVTLTHVFVSGPGRGASDAVKSGAVWVLDALPAPGAGSEARAEAAEGDDFEERAEKRRRVSAAKAAVASSRAALLGEAAATSDEAAAAAEDDEPIPDATAPTAMSGVGSSSDVAIASAEEEPHSPEVRPRRTRPRRLTADTIGEPCARFVTDAATQEVEVELGTWPSGRYLVVEFTDTHGRGERVDVGFVAFIGYFGRHRQPDDSERTPLGPWMRRSVRRPWVHEGLLASTFSGGGWVCDGRDFAGGCRSGFTDFHQTSEYTVTFRCKASGFDLCEACAADPDLGRATPDAVRADLDALRGGPASCQLACSRLRNSLARNWSVALPRYFAMGLLDALWVAMQEGPAPGASSGRSSGAAAAAGAGAGGSASSSSSPGLAAGTRVEARYMLSSGRVTSRWYPGRVVGRNGDGTYQVDYDDGDKWYNVPQELVMRRDGPPSTSGAGIGAGRLVEDGGSLLRLRLRPEMAAWAASGDRASRFGIARSLQASGILTGGPLTPLTISAATTSGNAPKGSVRQALRQLVRELAGRLFGSSGGLWALCTGDQVWARCPHSLERWEEGRVLRLPRSQQGSHPPLRMVRRPPPSGLHSLDSAGFSAWVPVTPPPPVSTLIASAASVRGGDGAARGAEAGRPQVLSPLAAASPEGRAEAGDARLASEEEGRMEEEDAEEEDGEHDEEDEADVEDEDGERDEGSGADVRDDPDAAAADAHAFERVPGLAPREVPPAPKAPPVPPGGRDGAFSAPSSMFSRAAAAAAASAAASADEDGGYLIAWRDGRPMTSVPARFIWKATGASRAAMSATAAVFAEVNKGAAADVAAIARAIQRGADLSSTDGEGATPLLAAVRSGASVEAVSALLDSGACPDTAGPDGETALEKALAMRAKDHAAGEAMEVDGPERPQRTGAIAELLRRHKAAEPDARAEAALPGAPMAEMREAFGRRVLPVLLTLLAPEPPPHDVLDIVLLLLQELPLPVLLEAMDAPARRALGALLQRLVSFGPGTGAGAGAPQEELPGGGPPGGGGLRAALLACRICRALISRSDAKLRYLVRSHGMLRWARRAIASLAPASPLGAGLEPTPTGAPSQLTILHAPQQGIAPGLQAELAREAALLRDELLKGAEGCDDEEEGAERWVANANLVRALAVLGSEGDGAPPCPEGETLVASREALLALREALRRREKGEPELGEGCTAYELEKLDVAGKLLRFLRPANLGEKDAMSFPRAMGEVDLTRWLCFREVFDERSKQARNGLLRLIRALHVIVESAECFPVWHHRRERGLRALTDPVSLQVRCLAGCRNDLAPMLPEPFGRQVLSGPAEPLASLAELRRYLLRVTPIVDAKYLACCLGLVGAIIVLFDAPPSQAPPQRAAARSGAAATASTTGEGDSSSGPLRVEVLGFELLRTELPLPIHTVRLVDSGETQRILLPAREYVVVKPSTSSLSYPEFRVCLLQMHAVAGTSKYRSMLEDLAGASSSRQDSASMSALGDGGAPKGEGEADGGAAVAEGSDAAPGVVAGVADGALAAGLAAMRGFDSAVVEAERLAAVALAEGGSGSEEAAAEAKAIAAVSAPESPAAALQRAAARLAAERPAEALAVWAEERAKFADTIGDAPIADAGAAAADRPHRPPVDVAVHPSMRVHVVAIATSEEVSFDIFWPMIRDDIIGAVREVCPRGALQSESAIQAGIAENGMGPIAQRLTLEEAETLATRVGHVVQTAVSIDTSVVQELQRERARRTMGEGLPLGTRIQFSPRNGGDWVPGVVVGAGQEAVASERAAAPPGRTYDIVDEQGVLFERLPPGRVHPVAAPASRRGSGADGLGLGGPLSATLLGTPSTVAGGADRRSTARGELSRREDLFTELLRISRIRDHLVGSRHDFEAPPRAAPAAPRGSIGGERGEQEEAEEGERGALNERPRERDRDRIAEAAVVIAAEDEEHDDEDDEDDEDEDDEEAEDRPPPPPPPLMAASPPPPPPPSGAEPIVAAQPGYDAAVAGAGSSSSSSSGATVGGEAPEEGAAPAGSDVPAADAGAPAASGAVAGLGAVLARAVSASPSLLRRLGGQPGQDDVSGDGRSQSGAQVGRAGAIAGAGGGGAPAQGEGFGGDAAGGGEDSRVMERLRALAPFLPQELLSGSLAGVQVRRGGDPMPLFEALTASRHSHGGHSALGHGHRGAGLVLRGGLPAFVRAVDMQSPAASLDHPVAKRLAVADLDAPPSRHDDPRLRAAAAAHDAAPARGPRLVLRLCLATPASPAASGSPGAVSAPSSASAGGAQGADAVQSPFVALPTSWNLLRAVQYLHSMRCQESASGVKAPLDGWSLGYVLSAGGGEDEEDFLEQGGVSGPSFVADPAASMASSYSSQGRALPVGMEVDGRASGDKRARGGSPAGSPTGSPMGQPFAKRRRRAKAEEGADASAELLAWCGGNTAVANALELLRILHTHSTLDGGRGMPLSSPTFGVGAQQAAVSAEEHQQGNALKEGSPSPWASQMLDRRLMAQLEDPLSVVTGALPLWVRTLPQQCPFLFSLEMRKKLMRYIAFGPAFAVHWMQEAKVGSFLRRRATLQTELNAQTDPRKMQEMSQELSNLEEHVIRSSHWLGTLQSTLAKVQRGDLLRQSERALELISGTGHLLEVQFDGETGFGNAVTQSFYVEVSKALQDRESNRIIPLWVEDDGASGSEYLLCRRGLLIRPLEAGPQRDVVVRRFRFLGRLMGQALLEGFIVPLPLAEEFFALVLGEPLRPGSFPRPGSGCAGELLGVLADFAAELATGESLCEAEDEFDYDAWKAKQAKRPDFGDRFLAQPPAHAVSFNEYLSLVGACFLETGLSGAPLCPDGAERPVTVENVCSFVEQAARFWFETGVSEQVEAFRQGLNEFVPVDSLSAFRPAELRQMFCGEDRIDWEESSLLARLRPAGGLTDRSPLFGFLVAAMVEMNQDERSRFLDFVSSCPRLPPGGMANFRLDVFPDLGSSRRSMPRSRACANQLYLPPYETKEEVKLKLHEAMHSSAGHHEQRVREL